MKTKINLQHRLIIIIIIVITLQKINKIIKTDRMHRNKPFLFNFTNVNLKVHRYLQTLATQLIQILVSRVNN